MAYPTIDQLKRALHLGERIEKLKAEMGSIFGRAGAKVLGFATSGMKAATRGIRAINVPGKKKRTMSRKARKAIAAAQKKRWAKVKAVKGKPAVPAKRAGKPKRKKSKMSAAGRAAIAAAQKARWAKVKAE